LAVLGKKKCIFISGLFLLDTVLAVTSSLSKRGRLLTSSWGAMGTILLRRALLSEPPSFMLWAGEEEYDTRLPFMFQNTGRMAVRLDVVE
jgi:hypothetical protein